MSSIDSAHGSQPEDAVEAMNRALARRELFQCGEIASELARQTDGYVAEPAYLRVLDELWSCPQEWCRSGCLIAPRQSTPSLRRSPSGRLAGVHGCLRGRHGRRRMMAVESSDFRGG